MKHFVCETCGYVPLRAENECDNPACLANPHSNHEKIRERIAEYEKRKKEDEERRAFKDRLRKSGFTTF